MKRKTLILILFVFLALTAYAEEDFKASAQKNITICPCFTYNSSILITNTGTTDSTYTLFSDENFSPWVYISPNNFALGPNEAAYANVYITVPCRDFGRYALTTYIQSTSGLAKAVVQNLNVLNCFGYSLYSGQQYLPKGEDAIVFREQTGPYSMCAGQSTAVPVLIRNHAKVENSYSLSLTGAGFASLAVTEAELGQGAQGVVLVTFNPTEYDIGTHRASLHSIGSVGQIQQKISMDIEVVKCYELSAEFDASEGSVCAGEASSYGIIVENKGAFTEYVNFSIDSRIPANLSKKSAFIPPNSSVALSVLLSADTWESGMYQVRFRAEGKSAAEGILSVEVIPKSRCYGTKISIPSRIKTDYSGVVVPVTVQNRGIMRETYKINITSPEWVKAVPSVIDVNPGSSASFGLRVFPGKNISEGEYEAIVALSTKSSQYLETSEIILNEGKLMKTIRYYLWFYQYYAYVAFLLFVLIFALLMPLFRRVKEDSYRRMPDEDGNGKTTEAQEKKSKSSADDEVMEGGSGFSVLYLAVAILIISVIMIFCLVYRGCGAKISVFVAALSSYLYPLLYFLISAILLVLIILFARKRRRRQHRNTWLYVLLLVFLIAAGLAYSLNLASPALAFARAYGYYIAAGIMVLGILIMIIKIFQDSSR